MALLCVRGRVITVVCSARVWWNVVIQVCDIYEVMRKLFAICPWRTITSVA